MSEILAPARQFLEQTVTPEKLFSLFWFVGVIGVIFFTFRMLRKIVLDVASKKCNPQTQHILGKAVSYTGVAIVVMTVFNRLGINFSALLGAAGIAGIALGFAAQTSVSNVISGLFMMSERAFQIGDLLQVDSIIGTVESIDFLSIRLKTPENQLVRIPNETIIKTNLINLTYFPIRRFTLKLEVSYGTDLRRVEEVLCRLASTNEYAASEPEPVVIFNSFGDSGIEVLFGVWTEKERFLELKNSLMVEVAEGFAAEGIVIPFPQCDVHLDKS